jgi:hypothetical protein
MGGQTDAHDYHRSAWTDRLLRQHLESVGFVDVQTWEGDPRDTSSHPISLNLKGRKPDASPATTDIRIAAIVPQPRWVQAAARDSIEKALRAFNIPMSSVYGVFWGQGKHRTYEWAVEQGGDWILSIDGDSMFTAEQLDKLIGRFGQRPDIDALAALQMRRGQEFPLFTEGHNTEIHITGDPVKVPPAHFGLPLIRTECLADVPKPWFKD